MSSRHFLMIEGGRKKSLDSVGLNTGMTQTQEGWTVSCHVAMKKVNTGQRTIFNKLIKSTYLNCLVNNTHTQKSTYIPHCCPLPTSPWFFLNSKWGMYKEQGMNGRTPGQNPKHQPVPVDALLLKRDTGQKIPQVGIFLFNTVVFLLRLVCWNDKSQNC